MRASLVVFVLCAAARATQGDWVNLQRFEAGIALDIRYATTKNFTGKAVYPEAKCLLRRPVAAALTRAHAALRLSGFGIKVHDCYRPLSVQKIFWALVPDERYVANPAKGSRHNRGAAVDVTLVDRSGREVEMPTGYDDFSEKAHRTYKGSTQVARRNSDRLEAVMKNEGFAPLPEEWWHFDFQGWEAFPVEDMPLSAVP